MLVTTPKTMQHHNREDHTLNYVVWYINMIYNITGCIINYYCIIIIVVIVALTKGK